MALILDVPTSNYRLFCIFSQSGQMHLTTVTGGDMSRPTYLPSQENDLCVERTIVSTLRTLLVDF